MQILPWHEKKLQYFMGIRQSGRLPHALLMTGPDGTGKYLFALELVRMLVVEGQSSDVRRMEIQSQFDAGTYPDYLEIRPLENKTVISVDQIRGMCGRLALTSHDDLLKVALIEPAESMTHAAANALLKTLEEPSGDALIILISENRGKLPQTIRSRCQSVLFTVPDNETAMLWLNEKIGQDAERYLELAGGAPLQAMNYHQQCLAEYHDQFIAGLSALSAGKIDVVEMAQKWVEYDRTILIDWLMGITRWMVNRKMGLKDTFNAYGKSMNDLKISVDRIDLIKLFHFQEELQRSQIDSDANLNRELFIEKLIITWSDLVLT
ncbi:MAG: hypothetical protein EP297_08355 [Gammaproteobacteria bacterium]|nr:MAG: hypothetical protein EP297_08355 [Gammaproteobacteria bacterium]